MTYRQIARRRFLQISATASLFGLSQTALAAAPVSRWQGRALGAKAQIVLCGLAEDEAAPLFAQVRDEVARLEGIFSLYQAQSDICRLNASQLLLEPAPELLEVLSLCKAVWQTSLGAFDPTVQPNWRAQALGEPSPLRWDDFGDVDYSTRAVRLKPSAEITLNGVAQGFITDRVADLLRVQGLTDLVVDTGEQRALGQRPEGGAWRVGVADPTGQLVSRVTLQDRAMATSSPEGSLVADQRRHIIDGRTMAPAFGWNTVSISHDLATVADALSTAACCLTGAEMDDMLAQFPGASVIYRG